MTTVPPRTPARIPASPVDPDWLALREPADDRARDLAVTAVQQPLLQHLADLHGPCAHRQGRPGLRVVDLGAGTGANLRRLAPRLARLGPWAAGQAWVLVDHDPRLPGWHPATLVPPAAVRVTTVQSDVAALADLLDDGPAAGADLVTAAALLDLLDHGQLEAVTSAVRAHAVPALFSLSVTGVVRFDPAQPEDGAIATAFNAHQRRDGRLGPDAATTAAAMLARPGWTVITAPSPWLLTATRDAALLDAYLTGRVAAAVEWRPDLAGAAGDWLRRRREQIRQGHLEVRVGHDEVLALPRSNREVGA